MVLSKTRFFKASRSYRHGLFFVDIASNGLDHEWIMPQNRYENLGDMDGYGTHQTLVGLLEGRLYKKYILQFHSTDLLISLQNPS